MSKIGKVVGALFLTVVIFAAAIYLDNRPAEYDRTASVQVTRPKETVQTESVMITEPVQTESVMTTEPVQTEMLETETVAPVQTEPQQKRFMLSFVGDCTFGTSPGNYYAELGFVKTVGEDYGYPFRNVLNYFEEDDATFLNLEGPLTDTGNPAKKDHAFHGPASFVNILTENSVEFATLANDHIEDYGQTGYNSTVSLLENAGIPFVERDASVVFELDSGLKVGVYGTTYFKFDLADMTQEIQNMKDQGAQLIIVSAHWGKSGNYREDEEQIEIGHAAIDAGAHIVWGTHPQVLQPIEEYNGGIIYYSLGNFSFGGNAAPRDMDSAIVQQEVVLGEDGTVTLGEHAVIPVRISSVEQISNFQPTPYDAESRGYERVLEKLSGTYQGRNLT